MTNDTVLAILILLYLSILFAALGAAIAWYIDRTKGRKP